MNRPPNASRGGFTLAEMLVVVTIIGILAALITTAVAGALTTAREAKVQTEINGIDMALRTYNSNYGVPPDFAPYDTGSNLNWSDPAGPEPTYAGIVVKHLNKRFQTVYVNLNQVTADLTNYNTAAATAGRSPLFLQTLDPAEAIVFWLAGLPDPQQPREVFSMIGFNVDSSAPFQYFPGGPRTSADYDFDQTRLKDDADGDGWPEFYPDDESPPYVYFASRGNSTYGQPALNGFAVYPHQVAPGITGYAVPYFQSPPGSTVPVKKDSFQIIAAGVSDKSYGAGRATIPFFPSGEGFVEGDLDNITNFQSGRMEKGIQ